MIDKKTVFKSFIIILLLIIIIFAFIQIRNTLARYETDTSTQRDVDVAFWIVGDTFESARISMDEIYPSNTAFEYTFTVTNSNEDGTKIAETDLEYELILTTTTNLPLKYVVKREETICATYDPLDTTTQSNIEQRFLDDDGTYHIAMELGSIEDDPFVIDTIDNDTKQKSQITDTFVIEVTFPKSYSSNEEYRDLLEEVTLDINARQVID